MLRRVTVRDSERADVQVNSQTMSVLSTYLQVSGMPSIQFGFSDALWLKHVERADDRNDPVIGIVGQPTDEFHYHRPGQ